MAKKKASKKKAPKKVQKSVLKASQKKPSTNFKQGEWDWPEDETKWPHEIRRAYIKEILETKGFIARRAPLAKKMGVSRRQLYDDIKWIFKQGLPMGYLEDLKVSNAQVHKTVRRELLNALDEATDPKSRALVANALLKSLESEVEFAESFGVKDREILKLETEYILRWGKKKKEEK